MREAVYPSWFLLKWRLTDEKTYQANQDKIETLPFFLETNNLTTFGLQSGSKYCARPENLHIVS